MRRHDYRAVSWSFLIMGRHFKIPMILESQGRFRDTEKTCLSSNVLVLSPNVTSYEDFYNSSIMR